jgi:hypothetical protein
VEPDGHVVDIGKDCLLRTFTEDERRWESDFFSESERGIILAKDAEYPVQQLVRS